MFVLSLIAKAGAPLMIEDYACHLLHASVDQLLIIKPITRMQRVNTFIVFRIVLFEQTVLRSLYRIVYR